MPDLPRRIAIIQGHPDPEGGRLCHALAGAYAKAAEAAGHQVRRIDVAQLGIPFLRSQREFETGETPLDLQTAQAAIGWAEHVVIVFPLWLGTMPALLKAFLEQVLRPGFAFAYRPRGRIETLLGGRSARIVVTMGMPAWIYRWFYLAHGVRCLERNILRFVGMAPVRKTLFGTVGGVSAATRQGWFEVMAGLGRRGE